MKILIYIFKMKADLDYLQKTEKHLLQKELNQFVRFSKYLNLPIFLVHFHQKMEINFY